MSAVGTLNEKPLHAALKRAYAVPGDRLEAPVGRYVVDILRGQEIIEIQTRNFSAVKGKVVTLIEEHDLVLVSPVAVDKRIVKLPRDDGETATARRSPKHGLVVDVFDELVSFPQLVAHPRFSLEVALISEEEVRRWDPKRAWRRRGWVIDHRRLVDIVDRVRLGCVGDLAGLLPTELVEPFTTADLAAALGRPRRLAQRMAFCLRSAGAIDPVGKAGNAVRYVRSAVD
jgi:hypothetical protein